MFTVWGLGINRLDVYDYQQNTDYWDVHSCMLRCSLFGRWWSSDWKIKNKIERIEMFGAHRFTTNWWDHKPHVREHPSFLGLVWFLLAPYIRVRIIDDMVDFHLKIYCPLNLKKKPSSQVMCHRFEHTHYTERQTTAVFFLTHAPSNWFLPTDVAWIEEYCTFVAERLPYKCCGI